MIVVPNKMIKPLLLILLFLTACNSKTSWTCIEGNCLNGEGTKVWEDISIEKGNWVNGKLNGKGFQSFSSKSEFSGDTYTGEFKDGLYQGRGIYYDKSEDSKYIGEFKGGKPNGKGICKWGKNSKYPNRYYDGDWKNGLMHGYGTKFWGISENDNYTNNKYVGDWQYDMMDGIGKYEWADGSYYFGPWKYNNQHGDGVFVFEGGEVFKGHWEDGYCEALVEKINLKETIKQLTE